MAKRTGKQRQAWREVKANRKQAARAGYVIHESGELEHRVVWRAHNGRIPSGWVVHHIDEVKTNNDISNLVAMPSQLHDHLHRIQRERLVRFTKAQVETLTVGWGAEVAVLDKQIAETEMVLKQLQWQRDMIGAADLDAQVADAQQAVIPVATQARAAPPRPAPTPRVILRRPA